MEMKYVVPDMAQSFGTLEFAGESDHVFDRDKDNRRFFAKAEDIVLKNKGNQNAGNPQNPTPQGQQKK